MKFYILLSLSFLVFSTIGTSQVPFSFGEPISYPGLDSLQYEDILFPEYADISGDGVPDLIGTTTVHYENQTLFQNLIYYVNQGTRTAPDFGPPETIELSEPPFFEVLTFGDLNGNGKLDVLAMGTRRVNVESNQADTTVFLFFENRSSNGFDLMDPVESPFGLSHFSIDSVYFGRPQLIDADGDGDLDLFLADVDIISPVYPSDNFYYLENTGNPDSPSFQFTQTLMENVASNGFFIPSFGDLDGDGKVDIFGSFTGWVTDPASFYFLPNIGSGDVPEFDYFRHRMQVPLRNQTGLQIPSLLDFSGNGLTDLILSMGETDVPRIELFLNETSTSLEEFFVPPDVTVFPNPLHTQASVVLPNPSKGQYRLVDGKGRTLKTATFNGASFTLDLPNLSSGTYFLDVVLQESRFRKKVIKH